jgi:hypothetical protein
MRRSSKEIKSIKTRINDAEMIAYFNDEKY